MINFNPFITIFILAWVSNISLNLLGTAKMYHKGIGNIDRPIDYGVRFNGKRLIGDSSTLLGLLICVLLMVVVYLALKDVLYCLIPILVFIGDSLGSMIKRRLGYDEGKFLPVIDHGDYMIAVTSVCMAFGRIDLVTTVSLLVSTYVLHPIAASMAYKLKLRTRPF